MLLLPETLNSFNEFSELSKQVFDLVHGSPEAAEAGARLNFFARDVLSVAELHLDAANTPELLSLISEAKLESTFLVPQSVKEHARCPSDDQPYLWPAHQDTSSLINILHNLPTETPCFERVICWVMAWAYGTVPHDHKQWPVSLQCVNAGTELCAEDYLAGLSEQVVGDGTIFPPYTTARLMLERLAAAWGSDHSRVSSWANSACMFKSCWALHLYERWVWSAFIVPSGARKYGWMMTRLAVSIMSDVIVPYGRPACMHNMHSNADLARLMCTLGNMWKAVCRRDGEVPNVACAGGELREFMMQGGSRAADTWNELLQMCYCVSYMRHLEPRLPVKLAPFFPSMTQDPGWVTGAFMREKVIDGELRNVGEGLRWVDVLACLWDSTPEEMWKEQYLRRIASMQRSRYELTEGDLDQQSTIISVNAMYMATQWAPVLIKVLHVHNVWYTINPKKQCSVRGRLIEIHKAVVDKLSHKGQGGKAKGKKKTSAKKKHRSPAVRRLEKEYEKVEVVCTRILRHIQVLLPWSAQMPLQSWVAEHYKKTGEKADPIKVLPFPEEVVPHLLRILGMSVLMWLRSMFMGNYPTVMMLWKAMGDIMVCMQEIMQALHSLVNSASSSGIKDDVLGLVGGELEWLAWMRVSVARISILLAGWVIKSNSMRAMYTPLQVMVAMDIASPRRVQSIIENVVADFSKITSITMAITMKEVGQASSLDEVMKACTRFALQHDRTKEKGGIDSCSWLYANKGQKYWEAVKWLRPNKLLHETGEGGIVAVVENAALVLDSAMRTHSMVAGAPHVGGELVVAAMQNGVPVKQVDILDVQQSLWASLMCIVDSLVSEGYGGGMVEHTDLSRTDVLNMIMPVLPSILEPRQEVLVKQGTKTLEKGPEKVLEWISTMHPGVLELKERMYMLRVKAARSIYKSDPELSPASIKKAAEIVRDSYTAEELALLDDLASGRMFEEDA